MSKFYTIGIRTVIVFILPAMCVATGCRQNKSQPIEVSGAEVVGCGEIETWQPVGKIDAPRTELGYVHELPALGVPVFKGDCATILAKQGTQFGIQVTVNGSPSGKIAKLLTRVIHPPIKDLNSGRETSSDEWDSPMNIGIPRFTGWVFQHSWELVPGEWVFQILSDKKVIAERKFTVKISP